MQNHEGNTLLHFASVFHPDIAEHLLLAGANVNIKNDNNDTPLMLAINQKNARLAKIILSQREQDLNFYNINGVSPLMGAMIQLAQSTEEQAEWTGVIYWLLARGANPNLESGEGDRAISDIEFFYKNIAPRLPKQRARLIEEYLRTSQIE